MPVIAVSIILQLICLVHCMRSGSSQRWAWILIIGSYIGVIAYLLVEVLPNLRRDPLARKAASRVVRALDPERERRRAAQELELNGSIEIAGGWLKNCCSWAIMPALRSYTAGVGPSIGR